MGPFGNRPRGLIKVITDAGLPVYLLLRGATRDGIGGRHDQAVAEQAHKLHEDWGFTAFKTSPYSSLDPDANRWGRICAAAADYFEDLRQATPENWEFAFDASPSTGQCCGGTLRYLSTKNRCVQNTFLLGHNFARKCKCRSRNGRMPIHPF